MQAVFFDADQTLREFAIAHPIRGVDFILTSKSFNNLNSKQILMYREADIISVFTHSDMLDTSKLSQFPKLKLIATRSTGLNHIDLDYCQKHHIQVKNVPYYGATTVAEFAFGLILNLSRHISQARQDMKFGTIHMQNYIGFDLAGKNLGIIGTGSIGQHMVQLAQGFGMKVLAYDPFPNPKYKKFYVSWDTLLKKSDIISLHIPSTPKNYHLLNDNAFKKMKKGVLIINTARGDIIDTRALYNALTSGKVGGAGLDVLENEDILFHDDILLKKFQPSEQILLDSTFNLKLMQHPNVIITPHIAFNTTDALERILVTTFENIKSIVQKN